MVSTGVNTRGFHGGQYSWFPRGSILMVSMGVNTHGFHGGQYSWFPRGSILMVSAVRILSLSRCDEEQ